MQQTQLVGAVMGTSFSTRSISVALAFWISWYSFKTR